MTDQQPAPRPVLDLDALTEPPPSGDPLRDRIARLPLGEVMDLAEGEGPEAEAARDVLRPADEAARAIRDSTLRNLQDLVDGAGVKGALLKAQAAVTNTARINETLQRSTGSQVERLRSTVLEALTIGAGVNHLKGMGSGVDRLRELGTAHETLMKGITLPKVVIAAPSQFDLDPTPRPVLPSDVRRVEEVQDEAEVAEQPNLLTDEDLEALGAPARRQVELLDAVVDGLQALLAAQQAAAADQAADRQQAAADRQAAAADRQAARRDARTMRRLTVATLIAGVVAVVASVIMPLVA